MKNRKRGGRRPPLQMGFNMGVFFMDHTANLKTYALGLQEVLNTLPYDAISQTVEVLWKNVNEGKNIYTMGNGGHCNTASHMINDLAKHTVSSDDKKQVVAQKLRFRTACFNRSEE